MRRQRRDELRHAEAGNLHEQVDEEEQPGSGRYDGDRQERRTRRRRRRRRGGGPSGLVGKRIFRRVRFRRDDGRQVMEVRSDQIVENQSFARG